MIDNILQDRDLRGNSTVWANWMSQLSLATCKYCAEQHGKIVSITVLQNNTEVNAHFNCICVYVPMRTKRVGTATQAGANGADVSLIYFGKLPDCYINKASAKVYGWKQKKGNLNDVLPKKIIGGDNYYNDEGKLPSAYGRVWHEADINYTGGYRNLQRLLYSNDGLVFVSYDHHETFYEITK